MGNAPLDDLLSTVEVAEYANRTRRTVQRWVEAGRLTPVKQLPGPTGAQLFLRSDVDRVLSDLEDDGEPNGGEAA